MRTNRTSFIVTFFAAVLVLASLASAQTAEQINQVKAALTSVPDITKLDHDGLVGVVKSLVVGDASLKDALADNTDGVCNQSVDCLRAWITEKVRELSERYGKTTAAQVVEEPKLNLPPDEKIGLLVDEIRAFYQGKPDSVVSDIVNSALAISNGDVAQLEKIRDLIKSRNEPTAPKSTSSTSLAEGQEAKVDTSGDIIKTDVVDNVTGVDPRHLEDLVNDARKSMPEPQPESLPSIPPRLSRDDARTYLQGRANTIKDGWNYTVDEARAEFMNSEVMEAAILKADEAKWEAALKQAKREILSDTKDPFLKAQLRKLSDTESRNLVVSRQQGKLRRFVNMQGCGPETILDIPPARFGSEYLMTINYNNPGYTDVQVRDLSGHALVQNLCEHAVFTLPAYIHFLDGPYVVAHYTVVGKGPDGNYHTVDSREFHIEERGVSYFRPRVGGGDRPTWTVRFPPVSSLQPAQAAGTRTVATGTSMQVRPAGSIRPPSICQYMPHGC